MKWKDPETIEELIQLTRQEMRAHSVNEKFTNRWACAYIPSSFALLLLLLSLLGPWPIARYTLPVVWFGTICLVFLRSKYLSDRLHRTHGDIGKMLRFLIQQDDLKVLGILIEALTADTVTVTKLFFAEPALREAIANHIADLLPLLDTENAKVLDTEQRQRLCSMLNTPNPKETFLYVAILKALVFVGGKDAEWEMGKLAVDGPIAEKLDQMELSLGMQRGEYSTEKHEICLQRLRETAQECLPRLQERLKRESVGDTLLRASDPTRDAPDLLLRPATEMPDAHPGQLLRVTSDRDSDS